MNHQSDKRRGPGGGSAGGSTNTVGGGGGGHILRAGGGGAPSHSSRHGGSNTAAGAVSATAAAAASGAAGGNMPAMPPRAAMVNMNSATDEPHDSTSAGSTTSAAAAGGGGGGSGGGGGGAPLADSKHKDKDRELRESNASARVTAGSPNRGRGGSGSPRSNKDSSLSNKATPHQQQQRRQQQETAQLLRDKDERITYLEKEMAIMEREFHQELDKLSQNESETATFWQGKHSALNQQYLRTDTELRLLRAEVDVREAEREELRQGVAVLRRELQERDEEIRRLRGQIRGLKDFVSTSTRTDDQTSDEVFGDGMTKLGNGLQNWVISNFRKVKLDVSKASEATLAELNDLVPMYDELIPTSKVHLLQSLVSRILVEMVFSAYYVGLSDDETRRFQQMEQLLSTFCLSDEPVNQWRSSTLALLRRGAQDLQDNTDAIAEDVISRTTSLLDSIIISPSMSTVPSPAAPANARDSALRVLVKNSIELARMLVVQKARMHVYMPTILPHQRVLFEPDTMEDIGGEEDEENLANREISCVVFPGVIKHGDENGGHMQYRNVIVKARVLCSPEE